ncbi:MAG: nucleotidyltransferase domain-containing protein [Paludibacter sp.]|jgi:predicted nucleotidyltransferase|nr:nucleotidyltransferase domain-containing protein [Paludibacter sp.]
MDKNDAVKLCRQYLAKVRKSGIQVLDAWIFGSYAKGNYHKDSDIDLAFVLPEGTVSFDTDVRLMALRQGNETMIETHTYSVSDFQQNLPIISQIRQYGMKF